MKCPRAQLCLLARLTVRLWDVDELGIELVILLVGPRALGNNIPLHLSLYVETTSRNHYIRLSVANVHSILLNAAEMSCQVPKTGSIMSSKTVKIDALALDFSLALTCGSEINLGDLLEQPKYP